MWWRFVHDGLDWRVTKVCGTIPVETPSRTLDTQYAWTMAGIGPPGKASLSTQARRQAGQALYIHEESATGSCFD